MRIKVSDLRSLIVNELRKSPYKGSHKISGTWFGFDFGGSGSSSGGGGGYGGGDGYYAWGTYWPSFVDDWGHDHHEPDPGDIEDLSDIHVDDSIIDATSNDGSNAGGLS